MYKVAIIGCGKIGFNYYDSHATAYLSHHKTKLVAVCDNEKFKGIETVNMEYVDANSIACKLWLRSFTDYKKMVKAFKPDIVSVCTPPETHCKIVCDIAPYVKGIYCEKPIATTLEDADLMIETCLLHGVVLQVNHQRTFLRPKFRFARGLLNTGTHAFAFVNHYFKDPSQVDFEYVDSDEHIFELQLTGTPSVPEQAIDELIDCIENKRESISSGKVAREALEQCMKMLKQSSNPVS